MTLQQLNYLVTVAECGSITEAAERLFISQPSLSAAIHNLEKEMGVTAFVRSNKGVIVTREGEELLSFARMLLEQADIMQEHFGAGKGREPKFCVSCQHYSFAVNAFVDVVQQYDADRYSFILRETQTGEIIDDVASGKSELGLLYLSESNESVLTKLLRRNELVFEELFTAAPHVFISKDHPLAGKDRIALDALRPYPYLVFEQGDRSSFYFAEELLSMLDMPKTIQVRDRATLGLQGHDGIAAPHGREAEGAVAAGGVVLRRAPGGGKVVLQGLRQARQCRPVFRKRPVERFGQQPLGQCPAQRQRLHHGIAQQLFGGTAALARGIRLRQRQHLGLRAEAEQELDAVRPLPCAHLPPAVQHQQTGPELGQRHPAQRILRSQLLTVHQPDTAVQRFAQLLRQPAAQFEPRGTGGHPEDAGIRLFCQHLPHDAALACARRTHQRGPAALLQGGRRRTAGRFV